MRGCSFEKAGEDGEGFSTPGGAISGDKGRTAAPKYSAGMWVKACRFLAMTWNQKLDCSPYGPDQAGPVGGPPGGLVELQPEQLRRLGLLQMMRVLP